MLKLTAYAVLEHGTNHSLFVEHGFFLVVKLKLNLDQLVGLNVMQARNGETQAATGYIGDMNDTTAVGTLAEDLVGTVEAGLFAEMSAKVKLNRENMLTTATDRECVSLVPIPSCIKVFRRSAFGANKCGGVVFTDVNFN